MADLKSRLERLRGMGLVKAAELPAVDRAGEPHPLRDHRIRRVGAVEVPALLGWTRSGEYLWTRETRHSLDFPPELDLAPFRLAQTASLRTRARQGIEATRIVMPVAREKLRLFDLETTGLSGGTGTFAFLAAIAQLDADGCSVIQHFLADYPGETAFLEAILEDFPEGCTVLTYNGSCFDIPLLRTRCIMNGMRIGSFDHVDALYLARRLWRSIHGGASLGLLEAGVLDVERSLDVPGWLIPGIWLNYLNTGEIAELEPVFAHNAVDVVSLAALTARAAGIFAYSRKPFRGASGPTEADLRWLGRTLIDLGDLQRGESILEAACAHGDEKAGLFLLAHLKRMGRTTERKPILDLLPRTFRSDIERAKYAEHIERDFSGALAYAERAISEDDGTMSPKILESLDSRLRRLSIRAGTSVPRKQEVCSSPTQA